MSCKETGGSKVDCDPVEGSNTSVISFLFFVPLFFKTNFVRHRVCAFTTEYLDLIDCNYEYSILLSSTLLYDVRVCILYIPAMYFCCCSVCCYTAVVAAAAAACSAVVAAAAAACCCCSSSCAGWRNLLPWFIAYCI